MRRIIRTSLLLLTVAALVIAALAMAPLARGQESRELLPKHVTPEQMRSVQRGLEYLAKTQSPDGSFISTQDGSYYPISMTSLAGMAFLAGGNTTTRGPYADQTRDALAYVMQFSQPNGLITGPTQEQGRPMHGHGFALMFMACAYGMETRPEIRARLKEIVHNGAVLTAQAQSVQGGWTYTPGSGDEGSVTVTQIQGLRAAHNNGFVLPEGVIEKAIGYLEKCQTPEGGIRYSFSSGNTPRPAISAAAVATLYNAGDYDSEMADRCMKYVQGLYKANASRWSRGGGHDYYSHFYASQAFYQAGGDYWDEYYPVAVRQLMAQQQPDGSWNGDGVGPIYGTSIALVIMQLPYKFLPIYQR